MITIVTDITKWLLSRTSQAAFNVLIHVAHDMSDTDLRDAADYLHSLRDAKEFEEVKIVDNGPLLVQHEL